MKSLVSSSRYKLRVFVFWTLLSIVYIKVQELSEKASNDFLCIKYFTFTHLHHFYIARKLSSALSKTHKGWVLYDSQKDLPSTVGESKELLGVIGQCLLNMSILNKNQELLLLIVLCALFSFFGMQIIHWAYGNSSTLYLSFFHIFLKGHEDVIDALSWFLLATWLIGVKGIICLYS